LENGRGSDDEVSGRMWKAVETKAREVRIAETERRGGKRESRKEVRRKGKGKGEKTEKTEKGKNNRCKKNGRRMKDMGEGERSSEVGRRG